MLADKFILPSAGVYLCGHSLGPMPVNARANIDAALHAWQDEGIAAWNTRQWIDLPGQLGAQLASLVGASAHEIAVGDSTVVNLFKAIVSAVQLQKGRTVILATSDDFPANRYIAQGITAFNSQLTLQTVSAEALTTHIDDNVAVLMLTHGSYRDAAVLDMRAICEYAHRFGVITVWDLSHSTGIVPVDLNAAGADFAVGCTYKYISGGPGSPAFIYINERHHRRGKSPIYGWMGHDTPFAFAAEYTASGSRGYLGGTPAILSMKGLEAALALFDAKLIDALYHKSYEYGNFLASALDNLGLTVSAPIQRGGHIAFTHQQGYAISRALVDRGVVCDYRHPGLIRLCVNPLYLTRQDMVFCVEQLSHVLEHNVYLDARYHQKLRVT